MMQVCVYDPSSRILCGSLDLCVCFQETRLDHYRRKESLPSDSIIENRNLHNPLLQRHIMPAICRELEFTLVLSRYGDATQ